MTEAGFAGIVISAAAAGLLARSRYERSHFVTERVFVVSPKLPDGYRKQLVFLTDLHDNRFGRGNETLLAAIGRIAPDAVLIGGDMMVAKGRADLTVTEELVKSLAARWPVYYGNGNHEERMNRERDVYGDAYDRLVVFLRETGVHYLSDESCDLDRFVRISGCNLDEAYYRHRFSIPRLPAGEIGRRLGPASGKFQILLFHSPLFFRECAAWGADLTLCGHFHGGTIRLPFLGGVMTPQYQFFLPWCAGRFEREGKVMAVSRGLGTHSINIRLNNRPQLTWITLEGRKERDG